MLVPAAHVTAQPLCTDLNKLSCVRMDQKSPEGTHLKRVNDLHKLTTTGLIPVTVILTITVHHCSSPLPWPPQATLHTGRWILRHSSLTSSTTHHNFHTTRHFYMQGVTPQDCLKNGKSPQIRHSQYKMQVIIVRNMVCSIIYRSKETNSAGGVSDTEAYDICCQTNSHLP